MMSVLYDANGRAVGADNPLNVRSSASDIMQPVDVQSRYQKTVQTHNAVSVGATSSSVPSTWIDCGGFSELEITLLNDASASSIVNLQWSHDGISIHADESDAIPTGAIQRRVNTNTLRTKARWLKVVPYNADAATHIMSVWTYLKA